MTLVPGTSAGLTGAVQFRPSFGPKEDSDMCGLHRLRALESSLVSVPTAAEAPHTASCAQVSPT